MWDSLLANARSQPLFDWKHALSGVDIEQFRGKYLNPAPGTAMRLRCPEAACCREECHFRTVREFSIGMMACCPKDITRPRIPLTREDIGMHRLNYDRIHKGIADALDIEFSGVDLDDSFFWELGFLKIGTGRRMPVYCSYYCNIADLEHRLDKLLDGPEPFILLVGKTGIVPRQFIPKLAKKECLYFGLDGSISIQPDGSFQADPDVKNAISRYKSASQQSVLSEYRCAPNTKWSNIHIRKKDSESISVWVLDEAPIRVNAIQLGLYNQVKGIPSEAFTLLLAFLASPNGSQPLAKKDSALYDSQKTNKSKICKALKRFFPTVDDGDPIVFIKGSGYHMLLECRDDERGTSTRHPSYN